MSKKLLSIKDYVTYFLLSPLSYQYDKQPAFLPAQPPKEEIDVSSVLTRLREKAKTHHPVKEAFVGFWRKALEKNQAVKIGLTGFYGQDLRRLAIELDQSDRFDFLNRMEDFDLFFGFALLISQPEYAAIMTYLSTPLLDRLMECNRAFNASIKDNALWWKVAELRSRSDKQYQDLLAWWTPEFNFLYAAAYSSRFRIMQEIVDVVMPHTNRRTGGTLFFLRTPNVWKGLALVWVTTSTDRSRCDAVLVASCASDRVSNTASSAENEELYDEGVRVLRGLKQLGLFPPCLIPEALQDWSADFIEPILRYSEALVIRETDNPNKYEAAPRLAELARLFAEEHKDLIESKDSSYKSAVQLVEKVRAKLIKNPKPEGVLEGATYWKQLASTVVALIEPPPQ